MKKIILALLLIGLQCNAQKKVSNKTFCSFKGTIDTLELFQANFERSMQLDPNHKYIQNMVSGILKVHGNPKDFQNFIIVPQIMKRGNIAIAGISGNIRYIWYDFGSFEIKDKEISQWYSTCIIAHEIAHQLNDDVSANKRSTIDNELTADTFMGRTLYLLNGPIEALDTIIKMECSKYETDHPTQQARLDAARKGYYAAKSIAAPQFRWQTKRVSVLYAEGYDSYQNNDQSEAMAIMNEVIGLNPNFEEAYLMNGYIALKSHDYLQAIQNYDKVIQINPKNECGYVQKGYSIMQSSKDYKKVIQLCDKVIDFSPKYTYAYFLRGTARIDVEDYDGAIKDFTVSINEKQNLNGAYQNRASCYVMKGEYQNAISDCNKAYANEPSESVLILRGQAKLYLEVFNFTNGVGIEYLLSYRNKNLKIDTSEAQKDFVLVINRNPKSTEAQSYYGYSLFLNGKRYEANNVFEKAIDTNPKDGMPYYFRGICNYSMGDDRAIYDIKKSCELDYGSACNFLGN